MTSGLSRSQFFRRLICAFLLFMACVPLATGALRPTRAQAPPDVLAVRTDSGGRPGEYELWVLWSDGVALAVLDDDRGTRTLTGHIAPETFTAARKSIEALPGIWELNGRAYSVPDGPATALAIRIGERRAKLVWDEVIRPCWGANARTDRDYADFAAAWVRARIAIATAFPCDTELNEGAGLSAELQQRTGCRTADQLVRAGWIDGAIK